MTRNRIAFAVCAFILSCRMAAGDTNLFNNGTWIVAGATDPASNARGIVVSVGGVPAGTFSELKLYRAFTGAGSPQIFSVKGSGAIRPALPPPGQFGGTFYLTGYWDCLDGLLTNLFITQLDLVLDPADPSDLVFTGQLSNLNSMQATDCKLKFPDQTFNSVKVEVTYTLYATRDFCVDQSRQDQSQGFPIVRMAANFIDGVTHQANLLRYISVTDQHCDCCSCYNVRGSVCGNLNNANSPLVCFRDNLKDPRLWLAHQDIYPTSTPSLIAHFRKPTPSNIKPQGFGAVTADPAEQNNNLWGNWRKAKNSYKAGKKIGKFDLTLEAATPQYYNCEAGACYY